MVEDHSKQENIVYITESGKSYLNSVFSNIEYIQTLKTEYNQTVKQFESIHGSVDDYIESVKGSFEEVNNQYKIFSNQIESTSKFFSILYPSTEVENIRNKLSHEFDRLYAAANYDNRTLLRFTDNLNTYQLAMDSNANLSAENNQEITAELNTFIADLDDRLSFEDFLNRLWNFLKTSSHSTALFIYNFIVRHYVALTLFLLAPLYQNWWQEATNLPVNQAVKYVQEQVADEYTQNELKEFFIVSATKLNVRQLPDSTSERLSLIPQGLIVCKLETSGGWSRICFFDENTNVCSTGWVFSRYLKNTSG